MKLIDLFAPDVIAPPIRPKPSGPRTSEPSAANTTDVVSMPIESSNMSPIMIAVMVGVAVIAIIALVLVIRRGKATS